MKNGTHNEKLTYHLHPEVSEKHFKKRTWTVIGLNSGHESKEGGTKQKRSRCHNVGQVKVGYIFVVWESMEGCV